MGRDDEESMATFASVAAMSQQLTPSPTKTTENTSEMSLFETGASVAAMSQKQLTPSPGKTMKNTSETSLFETGASVDAMSQKQLTPSPGKMAENTSETSLFESGVSPKEKNCSVSDKDKHPAQLHGDNIFESFEASRLLEECQVVDTVETTDSKSRDTDVDNIETNDSKSHDTAETNDSKSHDQTLESADVSCDTCMQLQASSNIDQSCDSPAPRSPQSYVGKLSKKLLTKSYKHLKRKLRKGKSKKFTRLKKSKSPASKLPKQTEEYSDSSAQVFDFESSVRSVCSESEPLPTFYHRKRQNSDTDSDWDERVTKKRKIRPPTPSR